MPDAYEKFVSLYELLFQIMDIAMAMNEPCILKNIIQSTLAKSILTKSILGKLFSQTPDTTDVDELLEELQNDVDLIQTNGFGAFEQKIIDMFNEFEEDNKQFAKLIQSFDDLLGV